ncbi:hypothetical protein K491DRAFT_671798 [Lophiostoma macrostomum CBS 122681]|uniref:Cupin 2 conserved barrel domain-containing protein n=1 Tax=Lophiostoma macrostomum CBS 122681 TaxID=1314788 RepID=A0A6A6SN91_9PLEO|nr:hypothetical protein K491DRAFT_671798 [Lophiostoma macrostomum CBS 122681]
MTDTEAYHDTSLNGAVSTRVIRHHERSFAFEVTMDLVKGRDFFSTKPPMHFHINQDEYIQSLNGKIALEIRGKEIVLQTGDPEYRIDAWVDHRSYPLKLAAQEGGTTVKFLLSGEKTPELFQLNTLFFENWYKYQDELVTSGGKIDMIQALSTFDAGGTYLSVPTWIPFGQRVSQALGIFVGRWVGSLLGYQPFHRRFSTDWGLACSQMESSLFQRQFSDRSKMD